MILARLRSLLFLTTVSLDLKKRRGTGNMHWLCRNMILYIGRTVQQILINMSCVWKCSGYILNDHWVSLAVKYHAIVDVHFTTQQCNISPAKLVFIIPCLTWWDAAASSGFVMQFAMNDGSWMPLAWKTLILRAMWLTWVGLNQFQECHHFLRSFMCINGFKRDCPLRILFKCVHVLRLCVYQQMWNVSRRNRSSRL